MENFTLALTSVFSWDVLPVIALGCLYGIFCGSMPGISATLAIALMVPVTFYLPPVTAFAAIASTVAMSIFAGDIPGALMRIPGVPSSAAYCDEAYAMTLKGEGEKTLAISLVISVIGGMIGAIALSVSTTVLAEFALKFQYFEYFWLACMGLTTAAFICSDQPVKGLISVSVGLLLSTVGYDIVSGWPRFTFGITALMEGIHFICALIGVFAVGEVCRQLVYKRQQKAIELKTTSGLFSGTLSTALKYRWHIVRGSTIGILVGALPGAGSDIAAWVSYGVSKRFSKEPEKYGTGHSEGIVAAAASNNASTCTTWVPALTFGIPGDSVTAIVIGVLYLKGLEPGPMVFLNQAPLVYSIFISFFLANLLMLPVGYVAIKLSKRLLHVPTNILMPLVLVFCMVGSFAINNSLLAILIILILGIASFFLQENQFPVAPLILGMVMGPIMEENFMQAMIAANGNLLAFFSRPIAAALGVVCILVWLTPLIKIVIRRTRPAPGIAEAPASEGKSCLT
jgi:putative tricarboxylic transport membrane protein